MGERRIESRGVGRLAVEGGAIFAVSGYPMDEKPEFIEHYWKLYTLTGLPLLPESVDTNRPAIYCGGGIYRVYSIGYGWIDVRLKDLGASLSDKVEITEILPPKTNLETKYYAGRWWKLTKKGWR